MVVHEKHSKAEPVDDKVIHRTTGRTVRLALSGSSPVSRNVRLQEKPDMALSEIQSVGVTHVRASMRRRLACYCPGLLLCMWLGGCCYPHSPHITEVSQRGDQLRFKVDGQSSWLTEAELPPGIDSAELKILKQTIGAIRDQQKKVERQKREAWIHETPEQAISRMRKNLPAGFAVQPLGPYVVASDCEQEQLRELDVLFRTIQKKCQDVRGVGRQISEGPIRVYYSKNETGYRAAYEAAMGEKLPPDHPMGGVCSHESPPRVFGLASVGNGSLAHEVVHILMMEDWADMPGWLNEGMAVALGCPTVSVQSTTGERISDYWLYLAILAAKQGRLPPLTTLLHDASTGYQHPGQILGGNIYVRWIEATGRLPAFYQTYRDTNDAEKALRVAFPGKTVDDVGKELITWITAHDENGLIAKRAGKTPVEPTSAGDAATRAAPEK